MAGDSFHVDTVGFRAMVEDLSRRSGRDFAHVLEARVARVLELAVKYTREKPKPELERWAMRHANAPANRIEDGEATLTFSNGERGGIPNTLWLLEQSNWRGEGGPNKLRGGKSFHDMSGPFRWNNARWARFQALLARRNAELAKVPAKMKAIMGARGLAKHSWYQVAEQLGIAHLLRSQYVPGWVKKARPSNGRTYQNGRGKKTITADGVFYEIINDYFGSKLRADAASKLHSAIRTTLTAYSVDLEKGVFDDIKARARRYPGIFTT